jgi:hypothetical protein
MNRAMVRCPNRWFKTEVKKKMRERVFVMKMFKDHPDMVFKIKAKLKSLK